MTALTQTSLYGMVGLASVMLAFAEGVGFPNALSLPLTLLALFVTERWKIFRLPTRWANVLGLAAVGLGVWEFGGENIEARLLSLAHVLVYLTWIVLFLEKSSRLYWAMCALATLHVAIGAVLTSSGLFGLMLFMYLAGAIWTLTIFTLDRSRLKFANAPHVGEGFGNSVPVEMPRASALETSAAVNDLNEFVWNRRSQLTRGIQLDPNLRWVSWPFISSVAATAVLSAVIGSFFFVFTPRIWVGNFTAFTDAPDTALRELRTGFAEEVQLGDIGQILESTHPVFEMRLIDEETRQPIAPEDFAAQLGLDEPLFRGSVLGEYANGKWRVGTTGRQEDGFRPVMPSPNESNTVRQEFRLEPTESTVLFAMPPHVACRVENRNTTVVERRLTSVLQLKDPLSGRDRLNYVVSSRKPRDLFQQLPRGTQSNLTYRSERDYYCLLPSRGLNRLQELSKRIAGSSSSGPAAGDQSANEIARRLEAYLKNSGEFGYTLDMSIIDPTIDPIEDFLFNRKQGHCEYFASALALMLRAVQIPARLVSGFKGGDFKPSTGYFIVQQRHAHVWVEAFLNRQWTILDPTPASRSDSVKSLAPKGSFFGKVSQFFSDAWSHHVVSLSFADQNTSLYLPLKEWSSNFYDGLREQLDAVSGGEAASRKSGTGWTVLLTVAGVVLVACGLFHAMSKAATTAAHGGVRWLPEPFRKFLSWLFPSVTASDETSDWRSRLRLWWTTLICRWRGRPVPQSRRVEFYERFLQVCRTAGWQPLPTQTAQEFVRDAEPQWASRLGSNGTLKIPESVVAQFYRVRFGGESLSTEELEQLQRQLRQLETEFRRRG